MKVFEEWKTEQRNEAFLKQDLIQWRTGNSRRYRRDVRRDVGHYIAHFVAEVRKADGGDYPGKTLYETLSSIQMFLRVQCKRNRTLIDNKLQYNKLCSILSVSVIAFIFNV